MGALSFASARCQSAPPLSPAVAVPPTASTSEVIAPKEAAPVSLEAATEVARQTLVVDGHVDLPFRLFEQKEKKGAITDDVSQRLSEGNFDWVRARAGGLDAPFMSIYVPARHQTEGGAKALADELIDIVEAIAKAHPEQFAIAKSVAEVERAFAAGMVALPMGIENGAAIEGSLDNLRHFHERGVRYITLTHSEDNDICDSSYATTHRHQGLSAFGKDVVREMNRLGVMVDVSHISDDAFWQVMEVSDVPVIASHSSCRHFTPGFERNMSDDMIRRMKDNGGVVMINYGSGFLTEAARSTRTAMWEARRAFMAERKLERDAPEVEAWDAKYEAEHDLPLATVEDVADHIDHVVKLAGIDHVGLGSDFDGVGDSLPIGLEDAEKLPNLFFALMKRGYTRADLTKIASANLLRVWRAVEERTVEERAVEERAAR